MDIANPVDRALLEDVYRCRKCENRAFARYFTPVTPRGPFHKFPPLIGQSGKLKLLFVGFNPRRTSNTEIHDFAMGSLKSFQRLSCNIDHRGRKYIGDGGSDREKHYDLHAPIVQGAFGVPFDRVAAVTEMYLCASETGAGLNCATSPCARTYLFRTIEVADPDYIITLGVGAWRFFDKEMRGIRAVVFHLPFPSPRAAPKEIMKAAENWAIAGIKALEAGRQPMRAEWSRGMVLPASIKTYR